MRKRLAAAIVATTLVASAVGDFISPVPASAQTAELCEVGEVEQFSDVDESDYGAAYILCMKVLGLSAGKGDGTFGPDDRLTRGQMASFLIRLWRDALGGSCPGGGHPFDDVDSSMTHAENISCLYQLGITKGATLTTYEPSELVSASQISRFLMRLWQRLDYLCPPAGNELEQAGACLTQLRVTPDATEATSGEKVIRSQMAVYVIGLWHNAAGSGTLPVPPARPMVTTPGEGCGLSGLGDWLYETWDDPEYGVAHSWDLWATAVSWDRPSQGRGDNCWWDAKLSLVCWEDGERYYSLEWVDVGQVAQDGEGYASVYMDTGDADRAREGRLPVVTSDDGYLAHITLSPGPEDEFDWTGYLHNAIADEGELQVVFTETGEWIAFEGAEGGKKVLDGCEEALPDTPPGYSPVDACRPDGLNVSSRHNRTTAGLTLPTWAARPTGVFKVAVLFVEFADARASDADELGLADNLTKTERYLEEMSNGRLDVRMFPFQGWITAHDGWEEYPGKSNASSLSISSAIVKEAALAAQRSSGFQGADYDSLLVVLPASRFGGGLAGRGGNIDGVADVARWSLVNRAEWPQAPSESRDTEWWFTAAHELVHNLGLADLYPYDPEVRDTPDPPANREWVRFEVGLMGLEVNFPVPPDAYPFKVDWPAGYHDGTGHDRYIEAREMLAWSRWQLGWLDEARVACLGRPSDLTVELAPVASSNGKVAMVAIPHHRDDDLVIVIESRRRIGYDRPEAVSGVGDNGVTYRYTDHSLPGEGVIVYLVRADRRSGELPLLLWTDSGDGEVDESPVMTPGYEWWLGQPGTENGQYRIEVLSSTETTDTIRVTFTP